MDKTFFPEEFTKKYSAIMGKESAEFFEYSSKKIPKSIWANSLKIRPELLKKDLEKKGWILRELFHENAFSLEGVQKPGQSAEFSEGLFNLQEKSSMIPAVVLKPQEKDLILDAAAAPGNKTLQLACLLGGSGKIVALEKNVERFKSLSFNMKKFGAKNVLCKRMDLLDAKKTNLFDKIILDAPCSSEGLVRKDFDALKNWTPLLVEKKAQLQKSMLAKCLSLLKHEGKLVYCTCSLSPEENEEVVQSCLDAGGCETEKFSVKEIVMRKGLTEYNGKIYDHQVQNTMRIYPQDNDSQAFYIAKIRKTAT